MEAVLLAGGFGTRIRPLTYTRPKPLLPLLNRPLLANIIERLPAAVDSIILPVNYLREQIEAYFEEKPDPRVILVEERQPLGTGGAIKNCQTHLSGTFLVVNGDVVCNFDLQKLIELHARRKSVATLSLWSVQEPWHFGVVQLDPNNRILRFVEKPLQGSEPSNLINAGHYVLEPEVLDSIPEGRMFSIERELYAPWADKGKPIHGLPFEGYWIDCGRPESLLESHRALLEERRQPRLVDRSAKIHSKATVDGYAIAEGCEIGAGARLERSILLPFAQVGRNAVVIDSILGEGVEIEEGAHLERAVVGDYAVVAAGVRIVDQRVGMRPADAEA